MYAASTQERVGRRSPCSDVVAAYGSHVLPSFRSFAAVSGVLKRELGKNYGFEALGLSIYQELTGVVPAKVYEP